VLGVGRVSEEVVASGRRIQTMVSTPLGWASFALANLLVSMLWIAPLAVGWLTGDATFYVAAAGIASFLAVPFSFAWLAALMIAERIDRTIAYIMEKSRRRRK
jgi:hypothetical protein